MWASRREPYATHYWAMDFINPTPIIPPYRVAPIIFELIGLLDEGHTLDREETRNRIADGDFYSWGVNDLGWSFLTNIVDPAEREAVNQVLAGYVNGAQSFGTKYNGIAYILAAFFDIYQQSTEERRRNE